MTEQNQASSAVPMRVGLGYDVHAFAPDRKLILGGVEIPHHQGLLGHSDADVLAHAVADALLGAIRGGDIGKLFPDTDPAYKGADSLKLLAAVANLVREQGFSIVDIDCVIAAQAPKLSPYRDMMQRKIGSCLRDRGRKPWSEGDPPPSTLVSRVEKRAFPLRLWHWCAAVDSP